MDTTKGASKPIKARTPNQERVRVVPAHEVRSLYEELYKGRPWTKWSSPQSKASSLNREAQRKSAFWHLRSQHNKKFPKTQ